MAQSNEFRAIMTAMEGMLPPGTKPEFRAKWRQLASALDSFKGKYDDTSAPAQAQTGGAGGGSGSLTATMKSQAKSSGQSAGLPPYISNRTQFLNQNPLRSYRGSQSVAGMSQDPRVDDFDEGYKARTIRVADGEAVVPGMAVTIINNAAYLATADDAERPCHAMAIRGTGTIGEIVVRDGGMCYGFIEGGDSMTKGRVILSVRPGYLTFDPAESPETKEIYQEVGNFVEWVPPNIGDSQVPTMCAFSFHYCMPASLV